MERKSPAILQLWHIALRLRVFHICELTDGSTWEGFTTFENVTVLKILFDVTLAWLPSNGGSKKHSAPSGAGLAIGFWGPDSPNQLPHIPSLLGDTAAVEGGHDDAVGRGCEKNFYGDACEKG